MAAQLPHERYHLPFVEEEMFRESDIVIEGWIELSCCCNDMPCGCSYMGAAFSETKVNWEV